MTALWRTRVRRLWRQLFALSILAAGLSARTSIKTCRSTQSLPHGCREDLLVLTNEFFTK